jgi:DNA-binding NtrC family response regulator
MTDQPKAVQLSRDSVFVLSADAGDRDHICRCVEEGGYHTQNFTSLARLEAGLMSSECMAAILDIDSVPLDNRAIRQLTLSFPAVCFLCTSREHFHPELKDAICYHLYACLSKPLDSDELHYFLKSIQNNETDSRGPPER